MLIPLKLCTKERLIRAVPLPGLSLAAPQEVFFNVLNCPAAHTHTRHPLVKFIQEQAANASERKQGAISQRMKGEIWAPFCPWEWSVIAYK